MYGAMKVSKILFPAKSHGYIITIDGVPIM